MCDDHDAPWAEGKEGFPIREVFYSGDQNQPQRRAEGIQWPASKSLTYLYKQEIADLPLDPKDFSFVIATHNEVSRVYMYTKDKDWKVIAKLSGKLWLLGQIEYTDYRVL